MAAAVLFTACSAVAPPVPSGSGVFEVDAAGAPAVVDQALTLDGLGEPIGFVSAVARCGDLLLFADAIGQVRRLTLSNGETLPSIARNAANMALSVDCPTRSVYLFGASGRRAERGRLEIQPENSENPGDDWN